MLKYHIQTIEVGASASSSLSFTGIPQIYDDLILVTSLRDNVAAGGWENAFIYPNNSSANMVSRFLYGWSTNTGTGLNSPAVIYHQTARGNNTANTFSNSSVIISNYSKSTFKSIVCDTSVERNDAASINAITSALWSDTTPVSSLTIVAASGAFVQYSSASLYGIKRGADGRTDVASGGTVTTSNGYTIHTFNASGTFVPSKNLEVEYLVIGGGGGGGSHTGGGGGAGGYRSSVVGQLSGAGSAAESKLILNAGSQYAVTVGSGGAAATWNNVRGSNGGNSSLGPVMALGGGAGGSLDIYLGGGASGGSGGGGSRFAAGDGTPTQGLKGGTTFGVVGGGGGGASAAGQDTSAPTASNGGAGLSSNITGTSITRAGGGGGAGEPNYSSSGVGGSGGGGNGSNTNGATAGAANTGSGGGGGGYQSGTPYAGGAGGSGVVIIRYLTPA